MALNQLESARAMETFRCYGRGPGEEDCRSTYVNQLNSRYFNTD